ncbi:Hydroxylamine reductase [Gossypium arboreum]|uniref:Hydroxylamine reductase n=1 Tax=Gossypium arboreum TaxID=29729 RepID=A0A0B0MZP1_GOSAR|nr:Hydroxylamine reductase [Gossypium arboreum]
MDKYEIDTSLYSFAQTNPVSSTRPSTRVCDLAVWHKSVYPIGLARPSTWLGTGRVRPFQMAGGHVVGRVTQVGELHRVGHGLGHSHVIPFRMSTCP